MNKESAVTSNKKKCSNCKYYSDIMDSIVGTTCDKWGWWIKRDTDYNSHYGCFKEVEE